jgi:quercetin dioxygenase-like cupin family protein
VIEEIVLKEQQQLCSNPHASGTEEYFFVVEGRCEVDVGGEVFLVSQGDLLRFDGDQKHVYRAHSENQGQVVRGFAVVVQAPRV